MDLHKVASFFLFGSNVEDARIGPCRLTMTFKNWVMYSPAKAAYLELTNNYVVKYKKCILLH